MATTEFSKFAGILSAALSQHHLFSSVQSLSSVQFSHSVVSDSLRPHESQHARPPCPSPTPRVHSNSHPSSQWCHPAISSSVVPFFSCPQTLPASKSFPMSVSEFIFLLNIYLFKIHFYVIGSLVFFLSFLFWPHHGACGILVPWPGIKHVSPTLRAQSLNH